MKNILRSPLFIINTLLFSFIGLLILHANADRLHLPQPIKHVLAAVANITGTGTANNLAAFAAVNQIGDSIIQDNGTNIGVGTAPTSAHKLYVNGKLGVLSGIEVGCSGCPLPNGTSFAIGSETSSQNAPAFSASFSGGWRSVLIPSLTANGFNGLTQGGDTGLIFSAGSVNTGALIIGAWTSSPVGIRLTSTSIAIQNSSGNIGIAAPGGRIDLSAPTVAVNGTLSKSAGSFLIDHPLDPLNKYLQHSFVESPEMRNMYYGQAETTDGKVTISLPDWWVALNGSNKAEYNYQFTPMGKWCQLYVRKEIESNQFTVASADGDCKFSWTLSGVRHDEYANAHRINVEGVKGEGNDFKPATYFHPDLFK